jgi:hypothetical protein
MKFYTTSVLTNMQSVFELCPIFNQPVIMNNITKVSTMNSIFANSTNFNNGQVAGNTTNKLFPTKPNSITTATNFGSSILQTGNKPDWLTSTWVII